MKQNKQKPERSRYSGVLTVWNGNRHYGEYASIPTVVSSFVAPINSIIIMKYFSFLLLFFVVVASVAAEELRVLTFNVHIGVGVDGKRDLQRTANAILKQKPDVVALQEVDRFTTRSEKVDQATKLAELTGMNFVYGQTIPFQGGEYGVAILSKLPILDHRMDELPQEKKEEKRGVLSATIQLDATSKFRFVCTHLSYENASGRLAQAVKINELFADDPLPGILAGDMNGRPTDPAVETLKKSWTTASGGAPTSPSATPKSEIDYVFFRAGKDADPKFRFTLLRSEVVADAETSDHRPVLSVLRIER